MDGGLKDAADFIQPTLERARIHSDAIGSVLDEYLEGGPSLGSSLSQTMRSRASERELRDAMRDLARVRELIPKWALAQDTDWALGWCFLHEAILGLGLLVLLPGRSELYGKIIACLGEAVGACHRHQPQANTVRGVLKTLFDQGVI